MVFAGLLFLWKQLDLDQFYRALKERAFIAPIVVLFTAIVIFLAPAWLAMMLSAIRSRTPSPFGTVHVIDLAFVFPALLVAAIGLLRGRPSSYTLAGPLLVLTAAMMGSLVIAEMIAVAWFTPDPWPLASAFTLIAVAATWLSVIYCRVLSSERV
jgi:hypothetical protein